MKNKLTPDEIAMIIVDFLDGELTTCKEVECTNCPLSEIVTINGCFTSTICGLLVKSAHKLNEDE